MGETKRAYKTINPDVFERVLRYSLATSEITSQLRDVVSGMLNAPTSTSSLTSRPPSSTIPVVVCQRATGKTTGLVYFVGERTLVTDGQKNIAVVAPTEGIIREFVRSFKQHFPTLREPLYVVAGNIPNSLCFDHIDEIYIEEALLFKSGVARALVAAAPVVVGVGTIERPRTITVEVW